jgi:hypothetical protein
MAAVCVHGLKDGGKGKPCRSKRVQIAAVVAQAAPIAFQCFSISPLTTMI